MSRVVLWLGWSALLLCDSSLYSQTRPNLVLINLDDVDRDLLAELYLKERFPSIGELANKGIRFTNHHVTTPLCCPSRASLLLGQYAHRTGVKVNKPDDAESNGFRGGLEEYLARGHDHHDLAAQLRSAGYYTVLIGKYVTPGHTKQIPAGWDEFYMTMGANYVNTRRLTTETGGQGKTSRTGKQYITDVETNDAVQLVHHHFRQQPNRPLFLYLAPKAVHLPSEGAHSIDWIAPAYRQSWVDLRMPKAPDLDEADFADKPEHLQSLVRPSVRNPDGLNERFRNRMLALRSVDDMIGELMSALKELHQDANTYVFLTSDNGYLLGHHRLTGKAAPYDRCTNVPLIVCGPGVAEGQVCDHLLAHIDIAPTLLDLAGVPLARSLDGKSFAPLLPNPALFPANGWRSGVLIENWAALIHSSGRSCNSTYASLRMYDRVFTQWSNGAVEYYDLASDPYQLRNMADQLSTDELQALRTRLASLKHEPDIPETTVSATQAIANGSDLLCRIEGFAEDDSQVDQVLLRIRRLDTTQYWNGSDWQNNTCFVTPHLLAPSSTTTMWRYETDLAGLAATETRLRVRATAMDIQGNVDPSPASVFFDANAGENQLKARR